MKPNDLKRSLEADALLEERIWAPHVENSLYFEGFSSPPFFGNAQPVHLEYCSGNGLWIAERARLQPGVNWVAVEIKWKRIKRIWSKIRNLSLANLIGVAAEALELTERHLKDESVDQIFINFPDPWPKRRHAKYRLMSSPFVQELHRILKPGGQVCFVTDDLPYAEIAIKALLERFAPLDGHPHYINHLEGYGTSSFEELWRQKERQIYYVRFIKRGEKDDCERSTGDIPRV